MKRKLKTLTEQFTDARSNYDRILGRVDKTLMTEQINMPGTHDENGLRMCKCKDAINDSCEDFWSGGGNPGNYNLNGDYFYSTWMKKHQVAGAPPQVGDFINIGNEPFIIDMVNDGTPGADFQGPGLPGGPNNYPAMIDCECCNSTGQQNCAGGSNFNKWTGTMPPNHAAGCPSYSSASFDCDGQGNCSDPGTGNGQYPTMTDCTAACPSCDTSTASPCAVQWWQNPNATWAANWINNRDCSNYTWPAGTLEQQALDIMNDINNYGTNTPNPQTGPFNGFQDIWDAGNNSGLINPHKNQFVGKMAKSKYSQCQKQACNC
tara:strand:+ start:1861 stop:2817 length:957 start_codon:yes stop_codon:yes gene_type:complete